MIETLIGIGFCRQDTHCSYGWDLAQEDGLLSIEDSSAIYIGNGWTSLTAEQEGLIKIKHQLTMTTGLDYQVVNSNCTDPDCLSYKNTPGTNWFYHNATYSLLKYVIENATETSYNEFTNQKFENKNRDGWRFGFQLNNSYTYYSTARDMARFGLLILNEGVWNEDVILNDTNYFSNMVNTSQEINKSLWILVVA